METNEVYKMKFGMKIAYAVGQVTDSIGYNAFYFFFLFFLTDYVGISPGKAGTISLVAIMWDACTDPFVGQFSDNLKSKYGRRRPMMLAGTIPYALFTFLIFHNIQASEGFSYVYYLIVTVIFWTCYKIFVIPFFSLGAELTDDFTERTSLRSWASVFLYIAVLIASSLPPALIGLVEKNGGTGNQAWDIVGLVFGIIVLTTGLISWNFTRGGENLNRVPNKNVENTSLLKSIKELLKLKSTAFLAISVFAWSTVTAIVSGSAIYLMQNNLHYSASRQSSYFIFLSLTAIVCIPIINFLSKKLDKKTIYVAAMSIGSISMLLFTFIKFPSYVYLLIYTVFYSFGNSVFWTIYYSMMYDISELDEFVSGKRREGAISALMSFCQKFGAAIATWFIGFTLSLAKYDSSSFTQSVTAERTILFLNTLIPGLIAIVAVSAGLLYPLTKSRYESLMKALVEKRKGKPYSTKGFDKLL